MIVLSKALLPAGCWFCGFIALASASDVDINRALLQAGCGAPTIKQISTTDEFTVYEANCFQSSHRRIIVTCLRRGGCHVSRPERDDDEEER